MLKWENVGKVFMLLTCKSLDVDKPSIKSQKDRAKAVAIS